LKACAHRFDVANPEGRAAMCVSILLSSKPTRSIDRGSAVVFPRSGQSVVESSKKRLIQRPEATGHPRKANADLRCPQKLLEFDPTRDVRPTPAEVGRRSASGRSSRLPAIVTPAQFEAKPVLSRPAARHPCLADPATVKLSIGARGAARWTAPLATTAPCSARPR